jgi:hypothetical protein
MPSSSSPELDLENAILTAWTDRGVLGSDPDRKHVFQTLLNEAAAIIKHDDPKLDYETLSTYIAEQVTNQGDNISPMLVKVARGKQTAIEVSTLSTFRTPFPTSRGCLKTASFSY